MNRSHKSLPRLYVEDGLAVGGALTLGKEQSLYLAAVLRMAVGDAVILFNGRDGAMRAELTSASKKSVGLVVREQLAAQTARNDLWYGFAPLKAARLDYLVQKATEMGVGTIQPVITRFTQGRVSAERMRANVIEAAEQCEVLNIPDIAPDIALPNLLAEWQAVHGECRLLLCDETAPSTSPVETIAALKEQKIGLLIGPEGGFSDDEFALLRAQPFVVPISLGPRVLRADTAAVAAMALVQAIIGDWR